MKKNVNISPSEGQPYSEREAVKRLYLMLGGRERKAGKESRFLKFLRSNAIGILAFILPAFILLQAYAAFQIYPIGDRSVLVFDLNAQYVYYFEHLWDIVRGNASPFISWSRNLSGELMGIFAYYLASPFTIISVLLPRSMMTESILIMQLCKVGAASVTFNFYLKRSKRCRTSTAFIFGLLYSLMSYMVVHLMNLMWLDGIIYLPLIILGIERIIDENRSAGFVIPLALAYMANFYIGWMITVFSVIYFLYYYFAGKNVYTFSVRSFLTAGLRFAFSGVTAAAAACWVLLPLYFSLKLGKFEFSAPDYSLKTQFYFTDFFKNVLPNTYDTYLNRGSPIIYCGVLTVLLVPLFYMNKKICFRQKAGMTALLMTVLLSMYIFAADTVWHGFQAPNGSPYRYSFTFSFVMLIMAAMTLDRLEGITIENICACALGLMLFAFYTGKQGYEGVTMGLTVWYTVVFTVVYAVLLRYISLSGMVKKAALTIIMGLFIIGELFGSTLATLNTLDNVIIYSSHSEYTDTVSLLRDTVSMIYAKDSFEDGVYRIEKNYHRHVNDPMVMGSYGISHSSSTFNAGVLNFLHRMGFYYGGNYIRYKGSTYISDAVLGIKYVMEGKLAADYAESVNSHYDKILLKKGNNENVFTVFENPYALPIAFMSDSSIMDVVFEKGDPFKNQNAMMSHLVSGEDREYFKPLTVTDTVLINAERADADNCIRYIPIEEDEDCSVKFILNAPSKDMVYMFTPTKYEYYISMMVNDKIFNSYTENERFENEMIMTDTLGRFEKGEDISLMFTVGDENEMKGYRKRDSDSEYKKELVFYSEPVFCYLDEEKFAEDIEKLRAGGLQMTSFSEDHITGTINAEKDGIMFTTISWEPGWTVKVDGETVMPVKVLDALIGVPLSAGQHNIEMTFFPKGLKAGIVISIAAAAVIAVTAVRERRRD